MREKIDWTFIDYSDNQPTIDLIEGKLGILSLLDEESRMPSGSDTNFVQKLYSTVGKPENAAVFKKPRFGTSAFTIAHYALDVTYEAEGFLEKNRDTVPDEQLALLHATTNEFLKEVLDRASREAEAAEVAKNERPASSMGNNNRSSVILPNRRAGGSSVGGAGAGGTARKPTLGSIFKSSLISLMDTIDSTNAHYIRCIKPNEQKAAWEYEPQMVLGQLRACGVLETIRISCAGYPTRWTFPEFAERFVPLLSRAFYRADKVVGKNRYYMLVKSDRQADVRTLCTRILEASILDNSKYQLGLTKIFFRAGLLASFEQYRTSRLNALATLIQKNLQRYVAVKKWNALKRTTIGLQSLWRMKLAQREVERRRSERAAILIQRMVRGWLERARYERTKKSVVGIQTRGFSSFAVLGSSC